MDDARLLTLRDRYEAGQFTTGLAFQPNQRQSFLRYLRQTQRFERVGVWFLAYGFNANPEPCPECESYSSSAPVRRPAGCKVLLLEVAP